MAAAPVAEVVFRLIELESADYLEYLSLRNEVLRKPLGLVFTEEEMKREPDCIHIGGYVGEELCMTIALVPEEQKAKMIQVATRPGYERRGIGSLGLKFCDNYCRQLNVGEVYCHARETAIPFYLKNGYVTEGDKYLLVGITHITMRKKL